MNKAIKVKWACPRCGADANEHGKGGEERCKQDARLRNAGASPCEGFLCLCDGDEAGASDHGENYANPCTEAHCYHCEWGGTFPAQPKGLEAWEKKALEAGWSMPDKRKKELKL